MIATHSSSDPAPRSTRLRWGIGVAGFVSGAVLSALACLASPIGAATHAAPEVSKSTAPAAQGASPWKPARPGPWGDIETLDLEIRAPESNYTSELCLSEPMPWMFAGRDRKAAIAFLKSAQLSSAQVAALRKTIKCDDSGSNCEVSPSRELIRDLTQDARKVIYRELSKDESNDFYFYGIRRPAAEVDAWLAPLSPEGRGKVKDLVWTIDGQVVLSNPLTACASLNEDDKRGLLRLVTAQPALMVRLKSTSTAKLGDLLAYWGQGRRNSDVEPVLRSMLGAGPMASIDIVHLLPMFVRQRLYGFPRSDEWGPDCHWSAANFHTPIEMKKTADPMEISVSPAVDEFMDRLVPVTGEERRLGDVVRFVRDGNAVHSAIYIADDILFTKNGASPLAPWELEREGDLREKYMKRPDIRVTVGRYLPERSTPPSSLSGDGGP